jgi:hypothetical protein
MIQQGEGEHLSAEGGRQSGAGQAEDGDTLQNGEDRGSAESDSRRSGGQMRKGRRGLLQMRKGPRGLLTDDTLARLGGSGRRRWLRGGDRRL